MAKITQPVLFDVFYMEKDGAYYSNLSTQKDIQLTRQGQQKVTTSTPSSTQQPAPQVATQPITARTAEHPVYPTNHPVEEYTQKVISDILSGVDNFETINYGFINPAASVTKNGQKHTLFSAFVMVDRFDLACQFLEKPIMQLSIDSADTSVLALDSCRKVILDKMRSYQENRSNPIKTPLTKRCHDVRPFLSSLLTKYNPQKIMAEVLFNDERTPFNKEKILTLDWTNPFQTTVQQTALSFLISQDFLKEAAIYMRSLPEDISLDDFDHLLSDADALDAMKDIKSTIHEGEKQDLRTELERILPDPVLDHILYGKIVPNSYIRDMEEDGPFTPFKNLKYINPDNVKFRQYPQKEIFIPKRVRGGRD